MKNVGRVRGSYEASRPIVIGKTTVYVHRNIEKLEETDEQGNVHEVYEYDEIQYTIQEYLQIMNDSLTDTQLALTELFELMEGEWKWQKYMPTL